MNLAFNLFFIALLILNVIVWHRTYKSYGKMMYAKGKLHGFQEFNKALTKVIEKNKANKLKKQNARDKTKGEAQDALRSNSGPKESVRSDE